MLYSSGSGEAILKAGVAGKAASQVRQGRRVGEAVRNSILDSARHFPGSSCGVVAIDRRGTISIECNSRIFAVASKSSTTPLTAGIIRSTFPVLDQHVCYEDDLLKVGLTKYPTVPNQMTIQLKAAPTLASLDSDLFHDFFLKTRAFALDLKDYCGATTCGFISDVKDYCHLVPFVEPAGVSNPLLGEAPPNLTSEAPIISLIDYHTTYGLSLPSSQILLDTRSHRNGQVSNWMTIIV